MTNDEHIEKLIAKMRNSIDKYAKAKANRKYLEQFRKSKKAILMNDQVGEPGHVRESYAYSHHEYLKVLDGLKQAIKTEEELGWRLKTAELEIEVWRTMQANNRKEFKAYGN